MIDTEMTLTDGRTVSYSVIGADSGPTILYFHGAPTSRLDLAMFEDALAAAGVRAVSLDRPGYGGSTPKPERRLDDAMQDARDVLDALGVDRFAVLGMSSGGPYAARSASFFGDRCAAVAVVAGVTDMGWPDAWDGFEENEAKLMRAGSEAAATEVAVELFGADGARYMESMGDMTPADEALFADEAIAGAMVMTLIEGFRQGVVGFAQDTTVQARPWSFDAGSGTAPVTIWHGRDDTLVPVAHAHHTAELLPGAKLEILDGHGHMSIFGEFPRIVERTVEPLR